MMWAAQYQQRPAPEDGDYFKAEWIKTYDGERRQGNAAHLWGVRLRGDGGRRRLDCPRRGRTGPGQGLPARSWRRQASSDVWVEAFATS